MFKKQKPMKAMKLKVGAIINITDVNGNTSHIKVIQILKRGKRTYALITVAHTTVTEIKDER